MCSANIFEAEPDMYFSTIAILSILIEIIVLLLQAKYGGKFFIPKRFRKGYFNYYRTFEEILKVKNKVTLETSYCPICLGLLYNDIKFESVEMKNERDSLSNFMLFLSWESSE